MKKQNPTASDAAKSQGFKSLTEVIKLTAVARSTLDHMAEHSPEKLQLMFDAAKYRKEHENEPVLSTP